MHSKEQLEEMQRLPLHRKIQITTARIIEWYQHYNGMVYVAFSGGKDSTVLLDIARRIYPDIPAVFSDTGLEFPEVRDFVKSLPNITIVRPEMNFRKVIETYGYPVVSKRVADTVEYGHKPGSFRWRELHGEIKRSNCYDRGFHWVEKAANAGTAYIDLYTVLDRVSCWCCCNKNLKELRNIYSHLPQYWERLKTLQQQIDRPFKGYYKGQSNGIFELEKRFLQEQL